MNVNIPTIKGKWFYKAVKIVVIVIIIVFISASILIISYNEKVIAFINAFYH